MKVKYWLLVMLVVLASAVNAQDWQHVLTQADISYNSFYYLNSTTGWYIADDGYLGKTTDGGATITEITTGLTADLDEIYFLDADTGFVASSDTLYKTVDGGTTWSSIAVPFTISSGSIGSIYFATALKGWVMASASTVGQVMYTTDGGENWAFAVDTTSYDLEAMDFYDDQSGIVVGGGGGIMDIYYTTDGTNWQSATLPSLPASVTYTRTDLKGVCMATKDTVYIVGWGTAAAGLQPSLELKSVDGGATWTYLEQIDENKIYDYLTDVDFKDALNGIAVGAGVVVSTTDGGVNWVPMEVPFGATYSKVSVFGDDIFVIGSMNNVIHSSDYGETWEMISTPYTYLYTVAAPSDDVLYAAGYKGGLFKSTDGGATWDPGYVYANFAAQNVQSLYFIDETTGFAAQSYGQVSRTTDGGETWEAIKADTTAATVANYGVYFFSADSGFAVGKSGNGNDAIYKTEDGGASWTLTQGLVGETLYGIDFGSSQNGAVVAAGMKILYTSDRGGNWQAATISGLPDSLSEQDLNDVKFISATEAVAVGEQVVLKTTDGGANWSYVAVDGLIEELYSVVYNNNSLWIMGRSSSPKSVGLYKSDDNGSSWSSEGVDYSVVDSTVTLQDMAISPSGHKFIVGYYNNIYAEYTDATGVEEEETAISNDFSLSQNYPNPFNPTTTIQFSIPQSSNVSIKVYNILGQEVKTLVNKEMSAGSYKISFDASDLASGVYIYSLRAGSFNSTKKMMLLK